ncbi:hypothetical protein P3583_24140 [Vibrio parahaemolyticus]|nr:hypothetical protein [Vibrio parahaemolyticus]
MQIEKSRCIYYAATLIAFLRRTPNHQTAQKKRHVEYEANGALSADFCVKAKLIYVSGLEQIRSMTLDAA